MNRRRRRRNSGSNLRWLTEALFQRQLRADYRASRGADYKICGPKIDSLTSETVRQANFPSPTYGAAATKHECPQPVTSSAVRTAVNYHFHSSFIAYGGSGGVEVDVLPNAWNQSVSDVVRIFDVPGQIPHKHFFFVQDAC